MSWVFEGYLHVYGAVVLVEFREASLTWRATLLGTQLSARATSRRGAIRHLADLVVQCGKSIRSERGWVPALSPP